MTSESRGSLLAMLEHQSVSAVVDAPQVPGASSSTRLSLPVSLPGSCGRSGRAPLTRTHVLLPWGPGSGGALGPVLLTVAAPAGEQKRQRLLLSRYRGGHTAPSLVLPWSEQRARPGLQETWQECEPARWENAAAAGRWRAAASTWRSHVFTPLPREGACMFTRPAQPLLTSHLVNQRAGLLPPCWWSRGRVIGTKAAIWKVGARRAAAQSPGLVEVLLSALHMALDSPLGAALLLSSPAPSWKALEEMSSPVANRFRSSCPTHRKGGS